jgi:hypothetical protein
MPARPTRWRRLGAVAAIAFATMASTSAQAATYHFSSLGNDVTGNGTLARPWQSIGRFNALDLNPGDTALFRAGDVFSGKMYLDATDGGTNAAGSLIAPVKIGSYGAVGATTRAKILSPYNAEGFVAYNAGGVELSDLEFTSGGFDAGGRTNGVQFLAHNPSSGALKKYEHIRVNNVVSNGFGLNGLQVWAHSGVGYDDVHVADSEFYNNGYSGVYIGATNHIGGATPAQNKYHTNVLVERVAAHNNPGFVGDLPITGHGVIMANVDGGAIQDSVAFDNGKINGHGNVGLWTYQSNAILIQRNVSYGNRSPGGMDGGGFDIDGGVTNSFIQYNHSFDNDGAGLLLAQFDDADPMSKNVIRYNLSVNDGRDHYGGITVWGANAAELAQQTVFHNNTVVVDKSVVPNTAGAVQFLGPHHDELDFLNNAFVALNGAALITGDTANSKSTFLRNSYWTAGAVPVLESLGYTSVQAWANASNQEKVSGQFVGVTANPQFADTDTYRLSASSPLIDAGRLPGGAPWPSWVTSLGTRDQAGAPLYQGAFPDIGAREWLPADFNGDGYVDGVDLAAWQAAFAAGPGGGGGAFTLPLPDADGDGDADGADFLSWQRQLLANYLATGASAAVPEPTAALLAAPLVLVAAGARRKRRAR